MAKKKSNHFKRNWDIYLILLSVIVTSILVRTYTGDSIMDFGALAIFFYGGIFIGILSIVALIRQFTNKNLSKLRLIIIIPPILFMLYLVGYWLFA